MSKDASTSVLSYLRSQNRPYSANDIVNNLHKEHGKSAVQKALDLLVADHKIHEKINGKQKAYVILQDDLPTASDAELNQLEADINANKIKCDEIVNAAKVAEVNLKTLVSQPTTSEAMKEMEELSEEVKALETKLEALTKGKVKLVTKEEKKETEEKHEVMIKGRRKRKRMCENILDAILESYPKSKKHLLEEVGIETDQDVGVKIPDI